jgi:lipopolysaccharide assembly protein A
VNHLANLFKLILFLLLLSFALMNSDTVPVKYLFSLEWQVPLSVAVLTAFAVGILFGLSTLLLPLIRARRELRRLRKQQRSEPPPA